MKPKFAIVIHVMFPATGDLGVLGVLAQEHVEEEKHTGQGNATTLLHLVMGMTVKEPTWRQRTAIVKSVLANILSSRDLLHAPGPAGMSEKKQCALKSTGNTSADVPMDW
jgi:hypothetical protein